MKKAKKEPKTKNGKKKNGKYTTKPKLLFLLFYTIILAVVTFLQN